MPSEKAHIQLAVRNQEALDHLCGDSERFPEWIATIAFYKALHVVEAVFTRAKGLGLQHGDSHRTRAEILKKTKRFTNLYKHYHPLWTASTIARYLQDHSTGKTFSAFTDYLTTDQVLRILVGHHLKQIQISSANLLSKGAVSKLTPPAPS